MMVRISMCCELHLTIPDKNSIFHKDTTHSLSRLVMMTVMVTMMSLVGR